MTESIFTVSAGADDGRARTGTGQYFDTSNAWLDCPTSGTTILQNFIRFDNVTIPSGATISSCVLRLIAYQDRTITTSNATIYLEDADDPAAPTSGSDVISRALTTGVDWDNIPAWTGGVSYDSVDFASELQTVIDRGGWDSGQAIIVNVIDNGSSVAAGRQCASYDHGTYDPPKIVVNWSVPYAPSLHESITVAESVIIETDLTTQENITISEHVTLAKSTIDLPAQQENIELNEYFEVGLDFAEFIPTISQDVDISEYIEISNIGLSDLSTLDLIEVFEAVSIELSALPDFTLNVSSGADDGYTSTLSAFNVRADNQVRMGNYSGTAQQAYFRFDNIPILGGYNAVIDSAILRLEARTVNSGTACNLTIHFQDSDDPITFEATAEGGTDILSAPLTSGVDWDNIDTWTPDEVHESPQLKTILQEVIDRPGWASGNAVIVHVVDNGSDSSAERGAKSYDYFPSNMAELDVSYTIPFFLMPNEEVAVSESITIEMDLIKHENINISESITMAKGVIDMPSQAESIEITELITMERGFEGTLPIINETVNLSEYVACDIGLRVSRFETITIFDTGNINPEPYALENINLSEYSLVHRGFEKEVDETFTFSDSCTIFNYTKWLRQNAGKLSQRFYFTLTGENDSTTDIEIPVSAIYARKRSGNPTYLQVTIPTFNHADDVTNRSSGRMIVEVGFMVENEISLRSQILSADLEDISTYEGPVNRSIVLSGHETVTYGSNIISFQRNFAQYKGVQNSVTRYRFPFIDPFVNPGDVVIVGDDSITAGSIVYIINNTQSTMEIVEGD